MPNGVVSWATIMTQQSFQTILVEILTRPDSQQCFYGVNWLSNSLHFPDKIKGKKNCQEIAQLYLPKIFPFKTQHSLVEADILFQFITY